MTTTPRLTSADLLLLSDESKRYELIEGDLYVSKQPNWHHQYVCVRLGRFLDEWNERTSTGVVNAAPGVIFAEDDDVAPDVVWVSKERLLAVLGPDGRLYGAPELMVEVLSPGTKNERRDRQAKLKLYSRRGVQEYWIVDWQRRQVEIYRRDEGALNLVATLYAQDALSSPLLPDFTCTVATLFLDFPQLPEPSAEE